MESLLWLGTAFRPGSALARHRSLRDPRQRGDAAADAGRPGDPPLPRLARALADGGRPRRGDGGDVIRAWQGLGYNRRALALHRAAQVIASDGLARRPDLPARRRAVHRGRDSQLRLRRGRASPRRQRRPGRAPHRTRLHRRGGAGADGSRRHRLPRADPTLRGVPVGGRMPFARHPRRAGTEAGAVRGIVPAAAGRDAARGGSVPGGARTSSTGRRSTRSSATGSSWSSRTAPSACRRSARRFRWSSLRPCRSYSSTSSH